MELVDYILVAVVAVVLGLAGWYIYKAKKNGKKCIGCPDSCACSAGNCSGGCSGCCNKQ